MKIGRRAAAYPYHYHLAEEELVVVLDGRRACARRMDGWSCRRERWCPFCAASAAGISSSTAPRASCAFWNGEPDVVLYPDSGKLGAFERLAPGGGLKAMFRLSDTVEYHDGEQPPAEE
jgi:hypothetical protein